MVMATICTMVFHLAQRRDLERAPPRGPGIRAIPTRKPREQDHRHRHLRSHAVTLVDTQQHGQRDHDDGLLSAIGSSYGAEAALIWCPRAGDLVAIHVIRERRAEKGKHRDPVGPWPRQQQEDERHHGRGDHPSDGQDIWGKVQRMGHV